MKDLKPYIPNILTIIRIVLTPIIMITGILKHTNIVIILTTIAALTDLFDGRLARKWKITTLTGAKLDAVADKLFAIGTIGCLITMFKILWIPFILEILLAITNLYYHFKSKKTESLMIGKIKTTVLFITVITGIITTFIPNIEFILNGLVYTTINLQVMSLFSYGHKHFTYKKPSIEDNEMHKEIMNDEPVEYDKTMILKDLKKIAKDYDNTKDEIE